MTTDEAIQLGRRLREGSQEAAMSEGSKDLSEDALEKAALAHADAIDGSTLDAASLRAAIEARDAAESLLVVLGQIGAADAERRVAARLAEIDARMLATRDAWGATAVATNDPWLRRIASLDASSWWLDLVALGALREAAQAFDPARAFRDGTRLAPMKLRGASPRLHADVVGMEDDPARVAIERGAIVARLFDGEVEVFAMGLRADQDDLPAGLCVVRKGGGVADITHVALGGAAGGKGHSGWWAPIAESGATALTVRFGDREESILLEIQPAG